MFRIQFVEHTVLAMCERIEKHSQDWPTSRLNRWIGSIQSARLQTSREPRRAGFHLLVARETLQETTD